MNAIETIDTKENDAKASDALSQAQALVIVTPEDYQKADILCRGWFELRKFIEKDYEEPIKKAKEAKKASADAFSTLVDKVASHTEPVQKAERIGKQKMSDWADAEEAKRILIQDAARAKAFKEAEDAKIKKAESLQAQGKTAQAEAEIAKPVKVAPIIAAAAPIERDTVISKYWSYEVVTPAEVKREFCKPDAGSIQASMNAYKKQGKTIEEVQERIGGIVITERVK